MGCEREAVGDELRAVELQEVFGLVVEEGKILEFFFGHVSVLSLVNSGLEGRGEKLFKRRSGRVSY